MLQGTCPDSPARCVQRPCVGALVNDVILTVAAISDVGRARSKNEDAYTVSDFTSGARIETGSNQGVFTTSESGTLLAISDGMGGHAAGEVASRLVLDSVRAELPHASKEPLEKRLDHAVHRANSAVFEAARSQGKQGMGATLTAVFVCHDYAYIAEVGDSRAYLLRQGSLRQLTRDQSLVQLLVDGGLLSPEDAKHSPQRNVILQAMGLKDDVQVAIAKLLLRRGDKLLLCSDGISNAVSDDELAEIVQGSSPTGACAHLVELANQRGGKDNLTVIAAELTGAGLELPGRPPTGTFQVVQQFGALPPGPEQVVHAAGQDHHSILAGPQARLPMAPFFGRALLRGGLARVALLLTASLVLAVVAMRWLVH